MKVLIPTIALIFLQGCVRMAISPAVEGRVTSEDGSPIEATGLIQHNQLENRSISTTANEDGYYSLSRIRAWTPVPFSATRLSCTVFVSAAGYKTVAFEADSYDTVVRNIQLEAE